MPPKYSLIPAYSILLNSNMKLLATVVYLLYNYDNTGSKDEIIPE